MNQKTVTGDIYLLTNLVNGKIYVGQTRCAKGGYLGRWKDHVYVAEREEKPLWYIDRAIKKHGKENFKIELLEQAQFPDIDSCVDWMDEREVVYIEKLNSRKNGYNLTDGGKGNRGWDVPIELRIRFKERVKGYSRLGMKNSEASRIKMIKSSIKNWSDPIKRAEIIAKRNATMSGRVYENKSRKPVLQYDMLGNFVAEYPYAGAAAKALNLQKTSIGATCRGYSRVSGPFTFRFKDLDSGVIPPTIEIRKVYGAKAKPVDQIALSGEIINTFPSAVIAGQAVGVKGKKISACIAGDYKTYKGYIWKFSNKKQSA